MLPLIRQYGRQVATQAVRMAGFNSRLWLHASAFRPSIELKMPSLSPTMTEGTIVKWMKSEGEPISAGDIVCEVQTDKAVVGLEADEDGILAKIVQSADSGSIQVGALIAIIAEDGEDWKQVTLPQSGGGTVPASAPPSFTGGSTPGIEINMPSLSPTMSEGTIVKWCITEGQKINAGDVLCEIQTDKAVVSLEADDDGILAKILVAEGSAGVKVGQLIALTVAEGEDWRDVQILAQQSGSPAPPDNVEPTRLTPADPPAASPQEVHVTMVPKVGPATNLLMAKYGIPASSIEASGPKGIIKGDVMRYIRDHNLSPLAQTDKPRPTKAAGSTKVVTAPHPAGYSDHPLSSMRAVIAKRLSQSKSQSPHGYATIDCNIDLLNRIRADYSSAAGIKISVNDMLIKAVGTALQHVPQLNLNTVGGDDVKVMPNVDVSVAVATPSGLITPIVKDVPNKSLESIAETVRDLASRARQGQLTLDEFQGGTFTISNLGMFGIREFTAIINPPQCAILAVGSGKLDIDGSSGRAFTSMRATLSFDRRFVDEALASDFMAALQKIIEQPEYLNIGLPPVVRKVRTAASGHV